MNKIYNEEVLDILGREYIYKSSKIADITEEFLEISITENLIIEKILKSLEKDFNHTKGTIISKELITKIANIKKHLNNILSSSKIKKNELLNLSELDTNYNDKSDKKYDIVKLRLNQTFEKIKSRLIGNINNLIKDIMFKLIDLINDFEEISNLGSDTKTYIKWYLAFSLEISKFFKLLKVIETNNSILNNHINNYRGDLKSQMKIYSILKEINKINPVSEITTETINVDNLIIGSIFNKNLYTKDSKLVKESYMPFTEEDIRELKSLDVNTLYTDYNINNIELSEYNIVIIDDEELYTDFLKEELSSYNFNLYVFNDSEKALNEIKDISPDLILLDLRMPNINGLEFINELRKHKLIKNDIPIIITSSFYDDRLINKSIKLGAFDYIIKPYNIKDLIYKIKAKLQTL
ncbi:MAG: response regulator [Spirochaetota bacterium]